MRTRRRIALIAGASAILLLALEVSARIYAQASGRERGLALDDQLGWRPLAGIEKRGALWGANLPARTNALGWRDKPRETAKRPGTRRALLLGDSYVFGVGVDDGLRVSEALEREVPGLEAWNLGVTAYGPDQELLLLESVADAYAPDDVVWFACLSNDVEDVRYERRYGHAKPWFELAEDRLVPHPPTPSLLDRLRDASYLAEFALAPLDSRRLAHRYAAPWVERDGLVLFGRIAERLAATAREHGARFVCVAIPSQSSEADAAALAELRARGLEPLDLTAAFRDADRPASALHLPDGHWNAAGHALAAREVARELRQPERAGTPR
ncbi:MAG: SGNH/GDSL hydrolase family protein [Planctomycetota bacterium]|nr:SGNH/GDSL hydrolase family protein [Planctomycetota bacterium]